MRNAEEKDSKRSERLSHDIRVPRLFGTEVTLDQLFIWMQEGAEIKLTRLSKNFTYAQYLEHYEDRVMPLLAVDERGGIRWVEAGQDISIKDSWSLAALIFPEGKRDAKVKTLEELLASNGQSMDKSGLISSTD